MDFGIALPTPADSWKTVKRAEGVRGTNDGVTLNWTAPYRRGE